MTEINGNPKVQYLVNMVDESELSGQAVTVCLVINACALIMHFLLTNS